MNRHRNGQFRERPASEARPMTTYALKCERVSKGNRTRAAKALHKRAMAMAWLNVEMGRMG